MRAMTWLRALPAWWQRFSGGRPGRCNARDEISQARELIRAIDSGGVPLYPMRVNAIARSLGLEVSRKAAMQDTVQRIREALQRV